jgi:penicillin-binding protein 2
MSRAFEESFGDSNGFGILMDAKSGAIRAMFSRPGFDPNRLVTTDVEYIRQLQSHPDHPFFNRTVQSAFPPGSTYKTLNFIAAVELGMAKSETRFYCGGQFRLGKRIAECWKTKGHGWIALTPALVHSCNIYFYNLGMILGVDRMSAVGRMFHLGEKTGVILSGEPAGILPTADWKKQKYGEEWTRGDDINMSIGQGFVLVTPLQQATILASLFNGGKLFRPYLVESVASPRADTLFAEEAAVRGPVTISDTTLAMVRSALREVVVHGTGNRASRDERNRPHGITVYGKTGTVQRAGRDAVERAGIEPEDHGWFLCYFEIGEEKYTAVVMKEAAGHGGTVAAPVIGRLIGKLIAIPNIVASSK